MMFGTFSGPRNQKPGSSFSSTAVLAAFSLLAIARPAAAQSKLPDGPGKEQVQRVCTVCHTIDTVTSHHKTRTEWQSTLEDMASRGAQGSDRDFMDILDYLAKNFGPAPSQDSGKTEPGQSAPAQPAPNQSAQGPQSAASSSQKPAETPAPDAKINVNKATASELASALKLPDESAYAIVRYRIAHGEIKNWDELKSVPGLDAHQLEGQKDRIEF